MLYTYQQQVQRFLRDTQQSAINLTDITEYVNRARREVALRTQSIRRIPPIQGSITSISLTAGGSGYTAPTITVTPPDFPSGFGSHPLGLQATATATISGGSITSISVTNEGDGYFQPKVTITDAHGTGAAATPVLSPISTTTAGQEVYPYSSLPLSGFAGVSEVFGVRSVSIIYSNYRYSLPVYSFSTYQAQIRQYPFQYQYVPTMGAEFGQGSNGSLYLYPIASTEYQLELDCYCLPTNLALDSDPETIPDPWTDTVPYFAAHLAYLELQNLNAADYYLKLYDNFVHRYSAYTRFGRQTNPYGRW